MKHARALLFALFRLAAVSAVGWLCIVMPADAVEGNLSLRVKIVPFGRSAVGEGLSFQQGEAFCIRVRVFNLRALEEAEKEGRDQRKRRQRTGERVAPARETSVESLPIPHEEHYVLRKKDQRWADSLSFALMKADSEIIEGKFPTRLVEGGADLLVDTLGASATFAVEPGLTKSLPAGDYSLEVSIDTNKVWREIGKIESYKSLESAWKAIFEKGERAQPSNEREEVTPSLVASARFTVIPADRRNKDHLFSLSLAHATYFLRMKEHQRALAEANVAFRSAQSDEEKYFATALVARCYLATGQDAEA